MAHDIWNCFQRREHLFKMTITLISAFSIDFKFYSTLSTKSKSLREPQSKKKDYKTNQHLGY